MKTKAILATLLVAAAASADARLASPFPRKAVPPDESGHWIVINGNPWSTDVKSKLAAASRVRPVADRTGEKSPPTKEKFRTSGEEISRFVKCRSSNA
jgi:hypothetical protein